MENTNWKRMVKFKFRQGVFKVVNAQRFSRAIHDSRLNDNDLDEIHGDYMGTTIKQS